MSPASMCCRAQAIVTAVAVGNETTSAEWQRKKHKLPKGASKLACTPWGPSPSLNCAIFRKRSAARTALVDLFGFPKGCWTQCWTGYSGKGAAGLGSDWGPLGQGWNKSESSNSRDLGHIQNKYYLYLRVPSILSIVIPTNITCTRVKTTYSLRSLF